MTNREDPRVTRSRALILDAATEVFLDRGYQGATVDQVAEAAGVAKRTIYNVYGEKDALFRATILRSIEVADRFSTSLAADVRDVADPASELPDIGARLAQAVLIGPVLPLRRLLVMESGAFPDLAAEYRKRAPEAVLRALSALFTRLAARGHLRPGDPVLTSEHFAFLVMGADLDRGMFAPQHFTADEVRRRALAGVDAFLRAYTAQSADPGTNKIRSGLQPE
jgi:TetR/AcrR family transcriptional regulator, mexJK operon transcriptional repressor